jgi:hypothetical protein
MCGVAVTGVPSVRLESLAGVLPPRHVVNCLRTINRRRVTTLLAKLLLAAYSNGKSRSRKKKTRIGEE